MLYVTTRNHRDSFTAQRAIQQQRGPDGGLYIPFRVNPFSPEEIDALAELDFNQCTARILNYLFHSRVSDSDLDYCVGPHPVRLEPMSHRIVMGECWHSSGKAFSRMVRSLSGLLRADGDSSAQPGKWLETGVRIAVLFGIYGELIRCGSLNADRSFDVSVASGDFSAPMSAWYARAWGLPIGNIVCCCSENSAVWELIYHGQLRTDALSACTAAPETDSALPEGLECLISSACGEEEALRFVEAWRMGKVYCPRESALQRIRKGMHVSVISEDRMLSTIPSVYATNSYLLSPGSAIAYAGLLDYRVRTGETRCGLVLAERNPFPVEEAAARAMKISQRNPEKH